jgi:hypothetical protein
MDIRASTEHVHKVRVRNDCVRYFKIDHSTSGIFNLALFQCCTSVHTIGNEENLLTSTLFIVLAHIKSFGPGNCSYM